MHLRVLKNVCLLIVLVLVVGLIAGGLRFSTGDDDGEPESYVGVLQHTSTTGPPVTEPPATWGLSFGTDPDDSDYTKIY